MNGKPQARSSEAVLLFDGHCAVCRRIGHWVERSARHGPNAASLIVRPIGDDPQALHALNADLDIWNAYATIHIVMPDGSMKLGGEAVAEVFRYVPSCAWFAPLFSVDVFGRRPFQALLDLGYAILADVRPLLGCESCGEHSPFITFVASLIARNAHARARRHSPLAQPPRRSRAVMPPG